VRTVFACTTANERAIFSILVPVVLGTSKPTNLDDSKTLPTEETRRISNEGSKPRRGNELGEIVRRSQKCHKLHGEFVSRGVSPQDESFGHLFTGNLIVSVGRDGEQLTQTSDCANRSPAGSS